MSAAAAVLTDPAGWFRTRVDPFTYATWADGRCWVLRFNSFPDHPLWTLFADGDVVGDLDDLPPAWASDSFPDRRLPELDAGGRTEVVDLMAALGPYGAEQGQPCDGDWCTCSLLTEDRIRTGSAGTGSCSDSDSG